MAAGLTPGLAAEAASASCGSGDGEKGAEQREPVRRPSARGLSPFAQRIRLPCTRCGTELRYGDQWRPTATCADCGE
eukprot:777741-Alexandrium_andersonii.AAC.1